MCAPLSIGASQSAQFDVATRLVAATERFFTVLGLWSEGWPGASGYWRPNSHPCAGPPSWSPASQYKRNSDPSAALQLALELTALGRSLGDDRYIAGGLFLVANIQAWAQPDEALRTADKAIGFRRKAGLQTLVGVSPPQQSVGVFLAGPDRRSLLTGRGIGRAVRDANWTWAVLSTKTISSISATCCGCLARGSEEAESLLQLSAQLSAPTFACFAERHHGETYMYLGDAAAPGAFAGLGPSPSPSATRSTWRAPIPA